MQDLKNGMSEWRGEASGWTVVPPSNKKYGNGHIEHTEIETTNRYMDLEVEPLVENEQENAGEAVEEEEEIYSSPKKYSWKQKKERTDTTPNNGNLNKPQREIANTQMENPEIRKNTFVFSKVNTGRLIEEMNASNIRPEIRVQGKEIKVLYPETEMANFLKIVKNQKAQGYTFMPKEQRIAKLILVGVHNSFNIEDVKEDIWNKLNNPPLTEENDFIVERLETFYSKTNNIRLCKLGVKTKSEEMMNKIIGLNCVCYSRIRWLEMKKQVITQCHNCLKFGHSMAGGCFNRRQCKACEGVGLAHRCEIRKRPEKDEQGRQQNVYADFFCVPRKNILSGINLSSTIF